MLLGWTRRPGHKIEDRVAVRIGPDSSHHRVAAAPLDLAGLGVLLPGAAGLGIDVAFPHAITRRRSVRFPTCSLAHLHPLLAVPLLLNDVAAFIEVLDGRSLSGACG